MKRSTAPVDELLRQQATACLTGGVSFQPLNACCKKSKCCKKYKRSKRCKSCPKG